MNLDLALLRESLFLVEDLLTIPNRMLFWQYLDKIEGAYGKNIIETIHDCVFEIWPSEEERLKERKTIIDQISGHLHQFMQLEELHPPAEWLGSFENL